MPGAAKKRRVEIEKGIQLHGSPIVLVFCIYPCCSGPAVKKECDEDKLTYTLNALDAEDPFLKQKEMDPDVVKAMRWLAELDPMQVNSVRETIIVGIERWAEELRMGGACEVHAKFCLQVVALSS